MPDAITKTPPESVTAASTVHQIVIPASPIVTRESCGRLRGHGYMHRGEKKEPIPETTIVVVARPDRLDDPIGFRDSLSGAVCRYAEHDYVRRAIEITGSLPSHAVEMDHSGSTNYLHEIVWR